MGKDGNNGKKIKNLILRILNSANVDRGTTSDTNNVLQFFNEEGVHILTDDEYFGGYIDPLTSRYASKEMIELFSQKTKFTMWRKMWVALAESTYELGLKNKKGELLVTKEQVDELKQFVDKINYETAQKYEHEIKHDVMAHVLAFGDQCPNAKGIIHLGATSCDITDNADLLIYNNALKIIKKRLVKAISLWADLAEEYKKLTIIGRTHFVPAQPTTLGKRITMWLEPLIMTLENIEFLQNYLITAKGLKGAVGTQASFLELCRGDKNKVNELNYLFVSKIGFDGHYLTVGQTYPRILDVMMIESLANVNVVLKKMATDERLMQGMEMICEPFGKKQKGSSAMPHKRNPMKNERLTGLARISFGNVVTMLETASEQWLERTLDDSSVRRIIMAQQFMLTDACLLLSINTAKGLVVYKDTFTSEMERYLPFMAIEKILMLSVEKGKDRQETHERLRRHAMTAIEQIHKTGSNPFAALVLNDKYIDISQKELQEFMEEAKIGYGLAVDQVDNFLREVVRPILSLYREELEDNTEHEIKV
ncbi:adenylosuccinate lyase [Candidatus Micrarchaeota archaeon]|nr:adenylosuccinate lyase [Candidatus Micrarchaeota archaeon]